MDPTISGFNQQMNSQNFSGSSGRSFSVSGFLKIAGIILLSVSVVAWIGLKIYGSILSGRIESLNRQKESALSEEDKRIASEIINFQNKSDAVKKLLKSHIYTSRIFEAISKTTISRVQWTSCNLDNIQRTLELSGRAADYSVLAKQYLFFEESDFSGIVLANTGLSKDGGVEFKISLGFGPEKFQEQN